MNKTYTIFAAVLFALLGVLAFGQANLVPGFFPTTPVAIATTTVKLSWLHANNVSGTTSTCSLTDRSTNCQGGNCTLWGPAPMGASGQPGSAVVWDFHELQAVGGFSISCTVANSVVGAVRCATSSGSCAPGGN
jgi:hypothetical protein